MWNRVFWVDVNRNFWKISKWQKFASKLIKIVRIWHLGNFIINFPKLFHEIIKNLTVGFKLKWYFLWQRILHWNIKKSAFKRELNPFKSLYSIDLIVWNQIAQNSVNFLETSTQFLSKFLTSSKWISEMLFMILKSTKLTIMFKGWLTKKTPENSFQRTVFVCVCGRWKWST